MKRLNGMDMKKLNRMDMKKLDGMNMNGSFSRILTIMICAFLMFSLFPYEVISVENPPTDRGDGVLENSGDWLIEEGEDFQYTNKTIIVNGNLTVNGTLTLTRCELVMNASYSTIRVAGDLNLVTTNISSYEGYYHFLVTGGIDMRDSHIFDIAGSSSFPYIGGLQLLTDDVFMEGSSIRDAEFTGLYINADVTLSNTSIIHNQYNVVVNGSAPEFINCTIRYPDSVNIFMFNGSNPILIEGEQAGEIKFDDELSSLGFGHTLHVHVTYENGTSIPGVTVTATSSGGEVSEKRTTDASGWVRNVVLPEETIYKTIPDKVYRPYRVTAEKFGLSMIDIVPFESDTTVEMVLTGDYFGETLTRGDYNGDGYLDLVVGVPRNRTGLTTPGAVFVFLNDGGLELDTIDESMADLTIRGVQGTGFGSVLASGDINGDGFDDLLLATPYSSENGGESGRVYFFLGNEAPAWNELADANLTFDGDPGSHLGRRLFTGNINNDEFSDFIIGDDLKSYIYYSTANPDEDFNSISEFTLYATGKGSADSTSQSVTKTQFDDDVRYDLDPQEEMHITDFAMGNFRGDPTEITLNVQFVTDRYFGYNSEERGYMYYTIDGQNWHETVRPAAPSNNWDRETTLTFDLMADGVTSMEQLENFEIYYKNLEGQQGQDHYIHFDYVNIDISAVPKGANHTLEAGNLSSGDVNGDGYPDLIISDISGQTVYFGGPLGISAPEILEVDLRDGNATRLRIREDEISISQTRPGLNGQFDDGWEGWQQVANSYGQKDNGVRWDIVETVNGDWEVHEGATGGFGSNQDSLSDGSQRDCRGMLRTDDFLVTDDMETIHFWYNFGARRFDEAGGWQGSTADQIRYRLYSADNDSVLMELAGWVPGGSNQDHDEDGTVDADITSLRGEEVYFGFEIYTNRGNSERAIAQVDNLTILPLSDIPYYDNGTLETKWFEFAGNLSSFTPRWDQEPNNGSLVMKFRTDNGTDWNDSEECVSRQTQELDETSNWLQFRIRLTSDGNDTPVLRDLTFAYLLIGQIDPLPLSTNYGMVRTADMNGDAIEDFLFLDESGSRGRGIDIYYGNGNLTRDYNASDIQNLYSGDVADFSVIDLESDGKEELCLIGNSTRIVDSNSDVLWEHADVASRIAGDVASDPLFHLNTGRIYFIPSHDLDIRVLTISTPSFVDPGEELSINVTLGNVGTLDIEDLTLYLNITADGYSHQDSQPVSLDSMSGDSYNFPWDVPAKEGVEYVVTAEVTVADDRVPGNNNLSKPTTSKQHGIRLTASDAAASAHGGDDLVYSIAIENIGTFETENVTLASVLPQDWTGEFRYADIPVNFIIVQDSVELNFSSRSPADEEQGDFIINLTATAETAISSLDLTATILRPDLIVEELRLLRADGVLTNDTIHGVDGDPETIKIRVMNQGPTYAMGFTLSLSKDGVPYEDFNHGGLDPGESVWFSSSVVPEEGELNLSAEVDPGDEVPEENETNNQLDAQFIIKGVDPVGRYNLSGLIQDIEEEAVEFAEISFQWGGNEETTFTDENGSVIFTIEAMDYQDGELLYFNATDGENITSVQVLLYSEDGGKHLVLTLNQYLVEVTGPDGVSSIGLNATITIEVDITNKGNTNATFVVQVSEVPHDWSVRILDLPGNKITLAMDGSASATVEITSSGDPIHSRGHQKYFVSIFVYSEIYLAGNDSFTHAVEVLPLQSLRVLTEGGNTTAARPGDEIGFTFLVENLGNEGNTFIPELLGQTVQNYEFNISYVSLEIAGHARFSLTLTMPYTASGSQLELLVGGSEDHISNVAISIIASNFYDVSCEWTSELTAAPGDVLAVALSITNTGNLPENITIEAGSEVPGVVIRDGFILLDMQEEDSYSLKITLPADALSGTVVPVAINLTAGPGSYLVLEVNITIIEVRDMSITLIETIIIPGTAFTIYDYSIEVVNTGNGLNTFHFKADGTHPDFMSPPDSVSLEASEMEMIHARIIVPITHPGLIDNYLVPMDEKGDYGDLHLRILSYKPDLETSIGMSQEGSTYYYDIAVTNNGPRYEKLDVLVGIPKIDTYEPGDIRWEGGANKAFLEIMPGDTGHFTVWIKTPELWEHWGSKDDLTVTLRSESGKSEKLTLHKPPLAIIGATIPEFVTFEDILSFTGSQSLYDIIEYRWDFGDGVNKTAPTVSYSFGRSGNHVVTLTVVDDLGLIATRSILIEIFNMLPIAVIQAKPLNRTVEVGQPIKLDASFSQDRDGEIVGYLWEFGEFGDFYQGMWPVIEHSYAVTGNYTITLHVTDNSGNTTNTTSQVTVIPRSEDTGTPPDVVSDGETTTDPLSYVPLVLLALVGLTGLIFILRKRKFINHLIRKIADRSERK